jgi:hypothetical protein
MEHCAARGEDRAAAGIERAIGMLITWRRVRMVSRGWRRVWAQSLARDPAHIFSEKVRESFQALPLKEHFAGGGVVFFGLGGSAASSSAKATAISRMAESAKSATERRENIRLSYYAQRRSERNTHVHLLLLRGPAERKANCD